MSRKKQKKPTPQQCIDAIIARDSGMPYEKVLATFELTPNQFYRAVKIDGLEGLLTNAGTPNSRLAEIFADEKRKRELFNMGEAFVRVQYDRIRENIPGERQCQMYYGTYVHPSNVEALVYYALAQNKLDLASPDRATVISAIQSLPTNLMMYLHNLGLEGLMINAFDKGQRGSPLAVLEVFDQAYQARTGDNSLFDLTEKTHLHKWGDNFKAPQKYWRNTDNVKEAVYHTLTEANPNLALSDRTLVISAIHSLPTTLQEYLHDLGLAGLMQSAFDKGQHNSPLAVLDVFDQAYQARTGDKSLFDRTQPSYVTVDGLNRIIRAA